MGIRQNDSGITRMVAWRRVLLFKGLLVFFVYYNKAKILKR